MTDATAPSGGPVIEVARANVGGDYWTKTLSLAVNDTLHYKIRIGGGGWEDNTTASNGNRNFVVPANDTTLAPQFWNNGNFAIGKNIPSIFSTPYAAAADTFLSVYMRVNLKGVSDNQSYGWTSKDVDSVCVMGGGPTGSTLDWGTPNYLVAEKAPSNSATAFNMPPTSFYSGVIRIPKSQVTAGQDISYKFRLGSVWSWGDLQRAEQLGSSYAGGNRHFTIPVGKKDTTLKYVYFGDVIPVGRANPDTCVVTFNVNVAKAIAKGGFAQGDTLQIQTGWFGTAVESGRTRNLKLSVGSYYSYKDTIVTKVGALLDYQYYGIKNTVATRENYYNFNYAGAISNEAERRQVLVSSKAFSVNDTANSITSARRQPEFPNGRKLARKVRVIYTVDLRPAYYQVLKGDTLTAIQGSTTVTKAVKDSIFKWGVWINGPGVGGWGNPNGADWGSDLANNLLKKMYDDGTHGDKVAHDSVYTMTIIDAPDSTSLGSRDIVGQVFKFGIYGSDNEGGKGGYGNNHSENIVDGDTVYTIASQFGSINPSFYSAWDYDNHKPASSTGVAELPGVAVRYTLEQNYPNPFNPSTKIDFSLPKQSVVSLKVFNVLGQEVSTLVNATLNAGKHQVTFDAKNLATGLYIYRITAGDFTSVKKMLLVK